MAERHDSNQQQQGGWLQRQWARLRPGQNRDIVIGQVGEGAANVVIGKNVIQIGTLSIPIWLFVSFLLILLVILVLLAFQILSPFWPRIMPEGTFNIAVAELVALDTNGQPTNNPDARELSSRIANFVNEQKDTIGSILAADVVVWGPAQRVGKVNPDDVANRAEALNADVLVYGALQQIDADRWQLEPQFYLSPDAEAVRRVEELTGIHALGRRLNYRQDTASKRDVTEALRVRLEALAQMLIGLSYLAWGDQEGYRRSAEILAATTESSEWAKRDDDTGQEILYLFLGNAYLAWAYSLDGTAPERPDLVVRARDTFLTAIDLNPDYARSFNGLGSAYFQLARAPDDADQCAWDWEALDQSAAAFQSALDAPPEAKPASGQVDFRARLGLARYHFWQGGCINPDQWDLARKDYQFVLDEYAATEHPTEQMMLAAGLAHTDMGLMDLVVGSDLLAQADETQRAEGESLLQDAIAHYASALELSRQAKLEEGIKHTQTFMPYYLYALCEMGQGEQAVTVLEDFVADLVNASTVRSEVVEAFESNGASWKECTNVTAKE